MFRKIAKHIYIFVKKIQMSKKGCRFEANICFDRLCRFEGYNFVSSNTYLKDVDMGMYSYVGYGCYLTGVKIGRYTSIGPGVKSAVGRHPISTCVSTHPQFFSSNPPSGRPFIRDDVYEEIKFVYNDGNKCYPIYIGNDVWIGANVTILDGVRIGDGAVIGAGSVVLHDVEPYSVVGGVPGKVLKKRFDDDQIEKLLSIKWWEKDDVLLRKNANCFDSIEKVVEQICKD